MSTDDVVVSGGSKSGSSSGVGGVGDTSSVGSLTASSNVWTNLKFQGEHGSAMTEKFRKLMGIKSSSNSSTNISFTNHHPIQTTTPKSKQTISNEDSNSNRLFEQLEAQYAQARAATHTNRGTGLGYK